MDFRETLVRMQAEYLELPGLKLTVWQASRLWYLPIDVCQTALGALVVAGFLSYCRRASGPARITTLDGSTWAVTPHPLGVEAASDAARW